MQANLLRDGIERTAEHVMRQIRCSNGRKVVLVRRFGKVAVYAPPRVDLVRDADNVIGTYTPTVQPEVIEGDLLVRLRELSAQMVALEDEA